MNINKPETSRMLLVKECASLAAISAFVLCFSLFATVV
jgi:hypothetical protein